MTIKDTLKQAIDLLRKKEWEVCDYVSNANEAAKILEEAIEQAQQEPVAWMNPMNGAIIDAKKKTQIGIGDFYPKFSIPLYTSPPQRQPQYDKTEMNKFVQDLYDKKMREGKHGHYETMFYVVHQAIEAAHGIKEKA